VGLRIAGDENVAEGNKIGTDLAGATAIGNDVGVIIAGGDRNRFSGNVVAGSSWYGIELTTEYDAPDGNVIADNEVGVGADGVTPIPNGGGIDGVDDGIHIGTGSGTVIEGNVIASNHDDGIELSAAVSETRIVGNRIGTDATGTRDLGNLESGVEIGGDRNAVGDPATAAGRNVISHTARTGSRSATAGRATRCCATRSSSTTGSASTSGRTGATSTIRRPTPTAAPTTSRTRRR